MTDGVFFDAAVIAAAGGAVAVGHRIGAWVDIAQAIETMYDWLARPWRRETKRLTPAQFEALVADNMRDPHEWIREAEEAFDAEQARRERMAALGRAARRHGRGWTTGRGPAPTKAPPPARPPAHPDCDVCGKAFNDREHRGIQTHVYRPRPVHVHRFDHHRETITEEIR